MLNVAGSEVSTIVDDFSPLSARGNEIIKSLGNIALNASVEVDRTRLVCDADLSTSVGDVWAKGEIIGLDTRQKNIKGEITTSGLMISEVFRESPVSETQLHAVMDASLDGKDFNGTLDAEVPLIVFNGERYSNLELMMEKRGRSIMGSASIDDLGLAFNVEGEATLQGKDSSISLKADIEDLDLSRLHISSMSDTRVSGFLTVEVMGNSIDNFTGVIEGYDLNYKDGKHGNWHLDNLSVRSLREDLPYSLSVDCDYLSAYLTGDFTLSDMPSTCMSLLSKPLPGLIPEKYHNSESVQDCELNLTIYKDSQLTEKVKLPVRLLEDLHIFADMNSVAETADVTINIPYLQQGKNKLIRDTGLSFSLDNAAGICNLSLSTRIPGSKGLTTLMMESNASDNRVDTDFAWLMDRSKSYKGNVSLTTTFDHKDVNSPVVHVDINPSTFEVNDSTWNVGSGCIEYSSGNIEINDLRVSHRDQYAYIHGIASKSPRDKLYVDLNDINLDYIFDTLNINYVVFGGDATGQISASDLFSGHPRLFTDNLQVANFTYNRSLLGDASIKSWLSPEDMSIHIKALIEEKKRKVANVDGAIWLNRDSLAFDFDANRLDVGFLKPFMEAFCDDITGHATGKASLYGTFKDINLTGKVYADSVKMLIGVTNTEYMASDTVLLTPGRIHLDNITLNDREGHTAVLNGYVTHEYFHNPTFKFTISDAKDFLCYDTNAKDNPIWYGTIYANGSGTITGVPGFIDVLVDMTTTRGSTFTFVIDDSEEAVDYEFLVFTDKRKEAEELRLKSLSPPVDTVPDFVRQFEIQKKQEEAERPTRYKMDLRITATPEAQAIIVMDPAAGDKIRAYGDGALRFTYNSEGEMGLFGTYTITKGSYNFTLQELIVREFKIREGSRITFTGDPLNASLDITAAYRVNAQLTDLDKSFATDNDLNRNNVPVEALLKVSGNMQSPDIDFDIDLPTLNQDVARKVRSIVSTSDMMNMQMVYLLALNRFYTPDYMNTDANNNEMASLASATLSTQLSSILGQLVDNWSFSPSFRTGKGDFSDMEVDLALSSTLLNNRLIFNGNLGYRDRATSNTTFVGDFDIEYLLNPRGTLRLKAYNHYNDQNYYLRSALTTQGLGIVYKRDFNHFLPGLFRRKQKKEKDPQPSDTVPQPIEKGDSVIPKESN